MPAISNAKRVRTVIDSDGFFSFILQTVIDSDGLFFVYDGSKGGRSSPCSLFT